MVSSAPRSLWLALHAAPGVYADSNEALQWLGPLLHEAEGHLDLEHHGLTPLLVWLQHLATAGYAFQGDPQALVAVTEAVTAAGGDPWQSLSAGARPAAQWGWDPTWGVRGLAAFVMTLRSTNAEARVGVMNCILGHPHRPAWSTLMAMNLDFRGQNSLLESLGQYEWLVPLLAKHGWDPRTTDAHGRNAAFYLDTLASWEAAQACGVDFQKRDHEGHTVLEWQEKRQKLTKDQRTWLVRAGAPAGVNDAQVWLQALTGKVSQLVPLIPDSKKQAGWRWTQEGGTIELNLLDAAAVAALRPEPSTAQRRRQVRPETSLLHRLLKLKGEWPPSSLALAHLAITVHQAKRVVLEGPEANTTDTQFLDGLARYARLAHHHAASVSWGGWWDAAHNPATEQGVRDAWLSFMRADVSRWAQQSHAPGGPIPDKYAPGDRDGGLTRLKHRLGSPELRLALEHQVVVLAQNILLTQPVVDKLSTLHEDRQRAQTYVTGCLSMLAETLAALPAAQQSLKDLAHQALSAYPALAARCLADERHRQAQQISEVAPSRSKPRTRC